MAQKAQGTIVYVQTALAGAKTITGITAASPPVVTSAAHGYANGDLIKITSVGGMAQVNNRVFVIANVTANTFELKGVDGTTYTTYTSGGSAYKVTTAAVGEVRGIPEMGGTEPNDIDASHLLSVAEEKLAGLPKQSNISLDLLFDLATAQHTTLIAANQDLVDRAFLFVKPNSFNLSVLAQVSGFRVTAGDVNAVVTASVTLTPRAAGAWSVNP